MANPIGQFINGLAAQLGNPAGPMGGIIRLVGRIERFTQGLFIQLGIAQPPAPRINFQQIAYALTTPDQTEIQ